MLVSPYFKTVTDGKRSLGLNLGPDLDFIQIIDELRRDGLDRGGSI